MKKEEAIRSIKLHMVAHKMGRYPHILIGEALEMAISALRAQQPRPLDRSRWRRCIVCIPEHVMDCKTCRHAARREDLEPCKSCVKAYQDSEGEELPGYISNNYCSFCGRPLTEEAREELERRVGSGEENS